MLYIDFASSASNRTLETSRPSKASMMSKLKRKAQRLAGDREAELWKSDRLVARFFKDKG
jgi:hypothetical protein